MRRAWYEFTRRWQKGGATRTKALSILLAGLLCLSQGSQSVSAATPDELPDLAEFEDRLSSYGTETAYAQYLEQYADAARPSAECRIEATEYLAAEGMEPEIRQDYKGMDGASVTTEESGMISWKFAVTKAGLYQLKLQYYPETGKSSDIQRSIFLDGELPYAEAGTVEFDRLWKSMEYPFQTDNRNNELKPLQEESPAWIEAFVTEQQGYYTEPLEFYLDAGEHVLTLVSRREPMALHSLVFTRRETPPDYEELSAEYETRGYVGAVGNPIVVETENAFLTSSPMLYPQTDRSGPMVTPYDVSRIVLNSIGGENWKSTGQWIEWEVEVPADGLYEIGMNVKQTWVRGVYVPRKLTIDGEVPFREAEELKFEYQGNWRQQRLGGDQPYQFYLTAGKHRIRMEAVLGGLAEIVREVEASIASLNAIYRRIVMLTGQDTDRWRDYQVEANIPGLREQIMDEYNRLTDVTEQIRGLTGTRSDKEAVLTTTTELLKLFTGDLEKIPARKDSLKTNIGALGTWLIQMKELPLMIDELYLLPAGGEMPSRDFSFWGKLGHEVKSLVYSFLIDYNSIGNITDKGEAQSITVWVGTGRDQANTMKSLIDESFTTETGIGVNLMLVSMDTLLQATLAGQGPDVAMMVGNDLPMNYALRGAVADLTQFADFSEIQQRFRPSAMLPFTFDGKCYALPETQTFNMMFYRKDILKELGLSVPETWDDVKAIMSVLSKNNMEFGMVPIPATQNQGSGTFGASNTAPSQTDLMYGMFLYQSGGEYYRDNGRASALDSDTAVNAFKEWTQYYTDYGLTREFDFQSRFRIGEVPIGIADYSMYNMLQVAAPEIKGLWGFSQVPGTRVADGTVDHTVPSTGNATVIMNTSKNQAACWEYLKWWTSAEVQTAYGRGMEALQGPAARYPTANIEALSNLPWPVEDFRNLTEQFENVRGIPQVPGGYFTARNVTNAFSTVVIDKKVGPREALMDNIRYINDEITDKRNEFGLG